MPTTIYGDSATFSLANTTAPQVVFPANGEPVDATVVAAGVQTVTDYIAKLGQHSFDLEAYGANKLRTLTSIASLKDLTGMATGDLVLYTDPSYVGSGTQGLLSGFGLFTFVESVTWPQTLVDGVTNAYLVVTPNVGSGRWVNVSAGVGWNVGNLVSFQPKPAQRMRQWHAENDASGSYTAHAGAAPAYVGTDVTLATGLPLNATIALDFDFSLASDTFGTTVNAQIEVSSASISGGTWTPIAGSKKAIGGSGATDDVYIPVHLGGFLTAPGNDTYDFRVALQVDATKTATVLRSWSARGFSVNATLGRADDVQAGPVRHHRPRQARRRHGRHHDGRSPRQRVDGAPAGRLGPGGGRRGRRLRAEVGARGSMQAMNPLLLLALLSAVPAGSLAAGPLDVRMVASAAPAASPDALGLEAIDHLALSARLPDLLSEMSIMNGGKVDAAILAAVPGADVLLSAQFAGDARVDVRAAVAKMAEDVQNNDLAPSWRAQALDFLRGAAALAVVLDHASLTSPVPTPILWGIVRRGIMSLLEEVVAGDGPTSLQRRVDHERKALGAFSHLSLHAASVGGLLSPDAFVDLRVASPGDIVWVAKPGDPKGVPRPAIVVLVDRVHGMGLFLFGTSTDRRDIAAVRIEARTGWARQMGLSNSTHFYVTNFATLSTASLPRRSGTAPPAVMIDAGQMGVHAIVQFVRLYPPPVSDETGEST